MIKIFFRYEPHRTTHVQCSCTVLSVLTVTYHRFQRLTDLFGSLIYQFLSEMYLKPTESKYNKTAMAYSLIYPCVSLVRTNSRHNLDPLYTKLFAALNSFHFAFLVPLLFKQNSQKILERINLIVVSDLNGKFTATKS